MYNHLLYLVYWIINTVILYGASILLPEVVALGVNKFTPIEAAVYSGFWMVFVTWVVWDFSLARGFKLGRESGWIYFLAGNILGVMAISVFAAFTGTRATIVGIFVLALAANAIQRELWWKLVSKRN